jgi:mannose-6-phosphate isomerase-like protein (cupin superfamily)
MQPAILKHNLADEFLTPEGCYIAETSNSSKDESVSIARARVEPGITTRLHSVDGTEERYLIVEGRGRVQVGNCQPTEVGPGDVVLVPAGVGQRIANVGDVDLVFYCICTPRFRQSNYRPLE